MKKLHQTFNPKNTPNLTVKYFTPSFYFKKVTPYSQKITHKAKNIAPSNKTFTPTLIFFTKSEKNYTNIKIFTPN